MRTMPTLRTLLIVIPAVAFCQTSPTVIPGVDEPPELTGKAKQPEPLSEAEKLLATVQIDDPDYTAKLLSTIDELIRQYPEYPNSYSMRVDHKYCTNGSEYSGLMDDINNAIKYYSVTLDGKNLLPDLYALRGKIEFIRDNRQQAIADLELAVKLDPSTASLLSVFDVPSTELKPSSSRCKWSRTDFDDLVKEHPADYRVYLFRGLYYDHSGFLGHPKDYATAETNFQKAIATNPKVGLTYYYLGANIESSLPPAERASASSQPTANDQKLLQAYGTAITLDPSIVPAYMARANIHIYLKHPNLALNDYNKAADLDPTNHDIYNRRAQLLMDNGKNREAIADFTKAIDNCRSESLLLAYYEQRADVLMRVGDYAGAVEDSSASIRLLLQSQVPDLLGLKQFRKLYPEYNGLNDERTSARLHAVLRPAWEYDVFVKRLVATTAETNGLASSFLSENYARRGNAYWLSGNFKKAISDYQRIVEGLSTYVKEYPDTLDRWKPFFGPPDASEYVDVRTVDYSQGNIVKLWLKGVKTPLGKPSTESLRETRINCAAKMIETVSVTNYDAKGNAISSANTAGWQGILPGTLGEALHDGMCKE